MQRFLEQDFATVHESTRIHLNCKPHLTARIDIRLMTEGDFQILNVSDSRSEVKKLEWVQEKGTSYKIYSYAGKIEFVIIKAIDDGQIQLLLKGIYFNNPQDRSKLIPYWIDYTRLVVNGHMIFDALTPAWHNKPYIHNIDVKLGEEVKIQVEWLPHRSDT